MLSTVLVITFAALPLQAQDGDSTKPADGAKPSQPTAGEQASQEAAAARETGVSA